MVHGTVQLAVVRPRTDVTPTEPPHGAGTDYYDWYIGRRSGSLGNNAETYLSVSIVVMVMDSEKLFMEVFGI
jgi:hypothetical protein